MLVDAYFNHVSIPGRPLLLDEWNASLGWFLTGAIATILLAAALHDVLARTVPNWMSIALAATGVVASALNGRLITSLLVGAFVFTLSGLCWKRGWLGGGDVKLFGAAAIAVPPMTVAPFVVAVALAGGVLSLVYLALGHLIPAPVQLRPVGRPVGLLSRAMRLERWRLSRGGPLPYAVAIAAGGLFVLL
jgi:prepilin peptidase CpaA